MNIKSLGIVLFLTILPCSLSFAAECTPKFDANVILKSVNNDDAESLVTELIKGAGQSESASEERGKAGLEKAIKKLVSDLFDGRTAASDKLDDETVKPLIKTLTIGIKAACRSIAAGDSDEDAGKKAVKAADLTGGDSHYYVLLGTVNSLEGDGTFSTGLETSLISTTTFPINKIPFLKKRFKASKKVITGTFEITFSEIGSIDEEGDTQTDPTNPFAAGGGFFRLNASLDLPYSNATDNSGVGFRMGAGFTTQPSDVENDVSTRGRGYAGIVFKASYGREQGKTGRLGKGEVFIGYAKDKFWKYDSVVDPATMETVLIDETNRIVVDARMDIPGIFDSDRVRLLARIFADLPSSGRGPSDIRISLLLTVNIGSFFPAK